MTDKKAVFIDTNIWIYAFLEENKEKRNKVVKFLEEIASKDNILVSIQVINEFHYVCLRKYFLPEDEIISMVDGINSIVNVKEISLNTYKKAVNLRQEYNFSFWDSLIVASALENNCDVLYSEDMHHNLKIKNLEIINPLKET
ncbi:PIN domain-containing protein [Persephonella sp. KM09-Lau-8]|uniref:PIN domain-containing protein n=1 Tax=Persephonella sp. KM09-Lau-8 TaxID=1158345 RepID=UPI0004963F87|nr:PIN domain-containing protein [Persephonella sp. KM09-Lau-8]